MKEKFLADVQDHKLKVNLDNNVYRHLHFSREKTSDYHFNITTWPGYLCISGDVGCFVFSRVRDMFTFFRNDELKINPVYWSEKLQAAQKHSGYEEFNEGEFEDYVKDDFAEWEFDSDKQKEAVWQEVQKQVLSVSCDGEVRAYDAASNFESSFGHTFFEVWDHDFRSYTYHFLWCLHAIVWGIQQYDKEN